LRRRDSYSKKPSDRPTPKRDERTFTVVLGTNPELPVKSCIFGNFPSRGQAGASYP
jgi:hypothetical protein